ncbi:MAG TPA: hypothetical protein VLJ37_06495 [bacterium]|nr:hypothetical protein [bacterium]
MPATTVHQAVFNLKNKPIALAREMSLEAASLKEDPTVAIFRLHHDKGGVAQRLHLMGTPGAAEALLRGVKERLDATGVGAAEICEAYLHGLALMIEGALNLSWEGTTWQDKFKIRVTEAALLNDPDCRPDADFVHAVNALWQLGIAVAAARKIGSARAKPLFEVALDEAGGISDPGHRRRIRDDIREEARRLGVEGI